MPPKKAPAPGTAPAKRAPKPRKDPPSSSVSGGASSAAAAADAAPPPQRRPRGRPPKNPRNDSSNENGKTDRALLPSQGAGDKAVPQRKRQRKGAAASSKASAATASSGTANAASTATAATATASAADDELFQSQLREMRVEMEIFPHGRKRRRKKGSADALDPDVVAAAAAAAAATPTASGESEAGGGGLGIGSGAKAASKDRKWSARRVKLALDRRDHAELLEDRDESHRTRGSRAAESHQFLRTGGTRPSAAAVAAAAVARPSIDDDADDGSASDDDDGTAEDDEDDDEAYSEEGADDDVDEEEGDDQEEGSDIDDLDDDEEYDNVILEADDLDAEEEEDGDGNGIESDEDDVGDDSAAASGGAKDDATDLAEDSAGGETARARQPRRFRPAAARRRAAAASASSASGGGGARRSRSKLYRMRNFKSVRMSERHGDALASFARGRHGEAIAKLQGVAKDLPSAPQVYASLAMVYEEMLSDLEKNPPPPPPPKESAAPPQDEEQGKGAADAAAVDRLGEVIDPRDAWLAEQLVVAKKAYGSYHIAALLCKRDYSFWVRAGDMAATIAGLHTQFMTAASGVSASATAPAMPAATTTTKGREDPDLEKRREHHRSEKQRWLAEAKNDYKAADNIKPPGIDIPAKLAAVCMELGSLSEALTILTDLRNRKAAAPGERSDFESSHRAWLLYADLMLRIGYECRRWNGGDQTMGNVSFRRWLRRHAKSFDWEERRLHALGMALEAAAGTECCRHVSGWLRRRAEVTGTRDVDASNGDEPLDASDPFESEKALLLEKSREELADFDRTTTDIDPDSNLVPSVKRKKARIELLDSHEAALKDLELEFGRSNVPVEPSKATPESERLGDSQVAHGAPLQLSASMQSVCAIASELMRHMILLKAYDGGRLVGDAVSLYFMQRAILLEKRAQLRRKFAERSRRLDSLLRAETIEGMQEEYSDDESDEALSDEDELSSGSQMVADSLRKGILTPELNVLYAACLLGERRRDFIAFKRLQAIDALELESTSYLLESEVDLGVSYDTRWTVFKRQSSGPLRRTEAFALVERAVRDSGRDDELSERLRPLFEEHVQHLDESQVVATIAKEAVVTFENLDALFKVVTSTARFQVMAAGALIQQLKPIEANILLKKSVSILTNVLRAMWTVKPGGTVPTHCVEAIETLSTALKLRLSVSSSEIGDDDINDWAGRIGDSVSVFCNRSEVLEPSVVPLPATGRIPFPAEWLTETTRAIALRAYNLSVSLNVARFSGWEDLEFRMELMRRRSNHSSYFGITMSDGMVSGLLDQHEDDVVDQWELLQDVLDTKTDVSIRGLMKVRRLSPWYRDATESLGIERRGARIAVYGEDGGLSILLSYSRACVLAARKANDDSQRTGNILNALSVLLPVLQFMLKYAVWEADIGKVSETRASVMDWRNSLTNDETKGVGTQHFKRVRRRTLPESKEETRDFVAIHGSFAGERKSPIISNLIAIPCDTLLLSWKSIDQLPQPSSAGASVPDLSTSVMSRLRQLRQCHSEEAAETASLHLAAATLGLISDPNCQNPFRCLQVAAMFASQGSKLGSSDTLFRSPLPIQSDCAPIDALVILGRAECLQALHFCTEAAFLCDFVASVCCMRLSNGNAHAQSLKQWNVVRALAYNTSVAIRHTAALSLSDADKKADTMVWRWGKDTIDELLRGREDCLAFVGLVRPPSSTTHTGALPQKVRKGADPYDNELKLPSTDFGMHDDEHCNPLDQFGNGSAMGDFIPEASEVAEV